jgi:predicted RNA polymerase sigma factor
MQPAFAEAARAARESYGRLVALLAAKNGGDIAAAEDHLAAAFASALATWPERGVPANPEAWLLTSARNAQRDQWRSAAARTQVPLDEEAVEAMWTIQTDPDTLPDQRLALLLACAHPAIDEAVHTPLMLQTVLGLQADTIARAFALPAATLAQRLVRAKRKIKDAGIRLVLPGRSELPARLLPVLEAVWGAFAIGWDAADELTGADDDLEDEARYLADLLVHLLPTEPEVLGLAACITLASARRAARVTPNGRYVPLEEQDPAAWDHARIERAERLLLRARGLGAVGRFQLEAAIQSAHVARRHSGRTDWQALALLHEGLVRIAPSLGAAVARAVALGHAQGAAAGLAALQQVPAAEQQGFLPAWAARAHLLERLGRHEECAQALQRAQALARSERVRSELERRLAAALARSSG